MNGPTQEQIDSYQRDGFLVVEEYMARDELERVREHFHTVFDHEWPTGIKPDEVNYTPGVTPPDLARQMCNVWKADKVLAATTLSERNGRWGAQLAQAPGMRLLQDNMIWKPPGSKALLAHQDAAYETFIVPQNMTTCWIALDDTHADTGTIYYARGSNHWPRSAPGGQIHASDDWTGSAQRGAARVCGRRRVGRSRCRRAAARSTTAGAGTARRRTSAWIASGARSSRT